MYKSGGRVPLALFDDLPLDLRHSPTIKSVVNELSKMCITGSTHVVNRAIASSTG